MNPTRLTAIVMFAFALSGCAAQQPGRDPIVDMKGVDPVQYEEDLAVCKQYAEQVGVARDTATGALVGAAIGGLAGAAADDSDSAKRAAGVGFVWPDTGAVLDKLEEELAELRAEVASGDRAALREELGVVLFVMANLARDLDIDPEDALREANAKFLRRFRHIEARLAEDGRTPHVSDLAELDALWNEARAQV